MADAAGSGVPIMGRLSREMTDRRHPAPPADHAAHDLLLVAAAADRNGQLPAALADCPDCRALHADLVALAAAVPHAALPARPRAYPLSPADAARLRPAGWRRWLAAIGTSRDAVTRPLALGLTTLGIAGLLVATVPGALPFAASSGAAPAPDARVSVEAAGPVDNGETVAGAPAATDPEARETGSAAGIPALVVVSGSMLAVGTGLLVMRRIGSSRARA